MFGLFNVVWYDGYEAYVSKFILEHDHGNITPSTMGKLENYISGNGDILKVDFRYSVDIVDIIELNKSTSSVDKLAMERFEKMYFERR